MTGSALAAVAAVLVFRGTTLQRRCASGTRQQPTELLLAAACSRSIWSRSIWSGSIWSGSISGGQGRGRTADLPIFSRTLVPTELPGRDAGSRAGRAVLTGFEPATSTLTGWRALQAAPQDQAVRTPTGIRTRVTALKGQRPGPLDDEGSWPTAS